MADAKRDDNYVPTLLGTSNADGTTPVNIWADPTTHRLLVDIAQDLGDLEDVTITSAAAGDILYYNGTNWVNLGIGTDGQVLTVNDAANAPQWEAAAGGGDFSGPASSTDNAIVRFDGTGGKTGQNSGVLIDESDNVTGVNQLDVDSANGVDINPGSDTDADLITVGVTGTPKITWDESSDGFRINGATGVILGSTGDLTHTIAGATITSQLEVHSEGTGDLGGVAIHRHSDNSNFGGHQLFMKSRGSHASPTVLQDNDIMGRIIGVGYDGTDYETGAEVRFVVDGTPGNNDMPGEIKFFTNAGSQTLTERMAIRADGSVQIAGLTASELVATDANKGLQSLAVATYPSLTEISYVKGVTSSIQTQLNAKQAQGDVLDDLNTLGASTTDGQFIVATGAGVFAYESGATARTSLGLGTGDSPQFTGIELGHATDTTLTRSAAGVVAVEGVNIVTTSSTDTLTNKTLTAPKFADAGFIADANGNELVVFQTITSAVNEIDISNSATGSGPIIAVTGGDANIDLNLTPKGTGKVKSTETHEFATEAVFDAEVDNGNSGTADTIDWGAGNKQKSTLTGNVTYTFTAPSGPCNLLLKLVQDATGSRTATWPATVKWPSGTAPTLTTTANAIDIVTFYYDGTNYYGQTGLNFS